MRSAGCSCGSLEREHEGAEGERIDVVRFVRREPDDTGRWSRHPEDGAPVKLAKTQRQHRIAKLLEREHVASQAHLVELLANEGVDATQATVSRDLEELGAIKVRVSGAATAYALPELPRDRPAPEEHLRRVLGEWLVEVSHSANVVVLKTPPGSAHVVGSALDRAAVPDILGTVAGDDTLLVVCAERAGGAKVARKLRTLAGI
jgi:transcriptional regulator of arginine metabolism